MIIIPFKGLSAVLQRYLDMGTVYVQSQNDEIAESKHIGLESSIAVDAELTSSKSLKSQDPRAKFNTFENVCVKL